MRKILLVMLLLSVLMLSGCGRTKVIDHPKATMTGEGVMVDDDEDPEEEECSDVTSAPEETE